VGNWTTLGILQFITQIRLIILIFIQVGQCFPNFITNFFRKTKKKHTFRRKFLLFTSYLSPALVRPRSSKLHPGIHLTCSITTLLKLYTWIAQWHGAGPRAGWSGFRAPAGAGNFSLHHRIQTDSGAHSASYPIGTRDSFPRGKTARAWSWPLTSNQCRGQECMEL
jgi:hypothetical protein